MTFPLYPSETELAVLVLGTKRARDWPGISRFLEDKHGLPRIDEIMGGRYWPAVADYFRARHGMTLDDGARSGPNVTVNKPFRVIDGPETPTVIGRRRSSRDHG